MRRELESSGLCARICSNKVFVLGHATDHFSIMRPINAGEVVGQIGECAGRIVRVIKIPQLDSLVDRVRGKHVLSSRVPLDGQTLATMSLDLQVRLSNMLVQLLSSALIVFEEPKLGLTVICTGRKETFLEG